LQVICKTRKNRLVKQECTQRFADKKQKTMISSQTMGYLHANSIFPKNGRRAATHFLFSVRHPLSRFLSWCKTLKNTQYYFVLRILAPSSHHVTPLVFPPLQTPTIIPAAAIHENPTVPLAKQTTGRRSFSMTNAFPPWTGCFKRYNSRNIHCTPFHNNTTTKLWTSAINSFGME
jgi:hypothetical protein